MTDATASTATDDGLPSVTFTVDEAFAYGVSEHQAGHLDEAEKVYAAVLARRPDSAEALNVMGILKYQRGEHAAAAALLRRVVEIAPQADGVWNNLGNVLMRLGEVDEAGDAFKRSLQLAPSADAWANLARVFRRNRDWTHSQQACLQALSLVPDHGPATHNLALALLLEGRNDEGVEAALRAMQLLGQGEQRRQLYMQLLLVSGEREKAAVILRAWLAQEPDNPYVRHHLAACTGEGAPERASDAYVEKVFDSFAPTFDAKLANLHYRAPQVVADAAAVALPAPARQFDVADIGCGTGLCGPLLQPWARRLAGCDLSGAMLERAARRGVYDELHKAELTAFLRARPDAFDVVVSADTLNYFGDLREVAAAMHGALRPGGTLVFTLEALAAGAGAPYRLQDSGRYAHDGAHARAVFASAGLVVDDPAEAVLRDEGEVPVRGWLVVARKTSP
ncbi:MAG TPA: tetratricopeptide repeat protein [Burkholderiaceae bacterium]